MPVAHVIGNHDCWTGPGSAGDPLHGKGWALRELGLERGRHLRRLGAWKLIVLDSVELTGGDARDPGYRDTPPGFAIVDLYRDGSSEIAYWSYREVGEREVSADGPARGA